MSASRHADRVVVVTGGGSGIGLAIARRFAVEGATVYLVGRDAEKLEQASAQLLSEVGCKVSTLQGDVSSLAEMTSAAATVAAAGKGVDVLINNAGLPTPSLPVSDRGFLANLQDRLSADVLGTATAVTAFLSMMNRGGSVLTMGSVYATTSAAGSGSYSAAKAAIVGLTRTLAVELGPRGIRANCVSPGWVDVPKWDDNFGDEVLQHLRFDFTRVPLRTAVSADKVASVYSFLAHEDAAAITGQDIIVDGGMSADLYVAPTVPGLM